jgi:hypothetical protein
LPPAISLSEHPCLQICAAAQWVRVPHRDRFRHPVVRELERPPSGDGHIARTVTAAFLTYWQPNTPVPS